MLASERGTQRCRTSVLFIGSIFAVVVAVAQLGLFDAFGRGVGSALRTDEFVLWTSDGGAIALICSVSTIFVAIAMPTSRNTTVVLASELTTMARWKIAILLVGFVGALGAVVAFLKFGDAFLAVGTSELGEVAGSAWTIGLVRFVAAVEVAIALLLLGHAKAVAALDILALAGAIIATLLVGSIMTILFLITSEMAWDTIGVIEFVRHTGEEPSITLGSGTVIFVLAIVTIFVVVTLPPFWDAFSAFAALELLITTFLVAHWNRGRGCVAVISGNGAVGSAVAPFALTSDVMAGVVD